MRKKELIQIHALFLQVVHCLIETENMPVELLSSYYALGVRPSSIHKSKQDHQEAIAILGNSIRRWFEQTRSKNLDRPVS